jgi:hypothetical protein
VTAFVVRLLFTLFTGAFVMVPPMLDLATGALALLLLVAAAWFLFRIIGQLTKAQTGFLNVGETFA